MGGGRKKKNIPGLGNNDLRHCVHFVYQAAIQPLVGPKCLYKQKLFKSACSCNPGFQVGCRFRAQLPRAIDTISAPSGSTGKIGFERPDSECISREQGEGGRQEAGENRGDARARRHQPSFSLGTERKAGTRSAAALLLLPVQRVLFSPSGSELWLSQVHLRPCVK